jgi:hypothetical protein
MFKFCLCFVHFLGNITFYKREIKHRFPKKIEKSITFGSKFGFRSPLMMEKYPILQGIPAFCDFTICDPRYFVILFQAKFHDFEEEEKRKEKKKKIRIFFFQNFFFDF